MDHNYAPLEVQDSWTKTDSGNGLAFPIGLILESSRRLLHLLSRSVLLRPKNDQLKPTSWLDGLRGFAALIVYFHHHQIWAHLAGAKEKWFENSFGYEGQHYFAAIHGIRTFFSGGHLAVAVFFVLSGYVLSLKPMSLVQAGDYENLAHSLSSGLFRRWIRLFLPTLATTLLWLTTWHAFGWWCIPFEPQPTYFAELAKWTSEVTQYAFLYKDPKLGFPWLYWNLHTWTIPFEFKGSLAIYTVIPALSMSTRPFRLLIAAALTIYFLYVVDGWYLSMFLSGMLLCDLDKLSTSSDSTVPTLPEPYKQYFFTALFALSIYLGGVPLAQNSRVNFAKSPGWHYLSYLTPSAMKDHKWFFLFWAATFLVASIPRIPWLRHFFNTRFCQYLGRVSFSLYLMHGPVIWTLGNVVYLFLGWDKGEADFQYPAYAKMLPISQAGPMGLEPAFWIAQIVLLPGTLLVANFVTVLIDEPSVRFAAWARAKTLR